MLPVFSCCINYTGVSWPLLLHPRNYNHGQGIFLKCHSLSLMKLSGRSISVSNHYIIHLNCGKKKKLCFPTKAAIDKQREQSMVIKWQLINVTLAFALGHTVHPQLPLKMLELKELWTSQGSWAHSRLKPSEGYTVMYGRELCFVIICYCNCFQTKGKDKKEGEILLLISTFSIWFSYSKTYKNRKIRVKSEKSTSIQKDLLQ